MDTIRAFFSKIRALFSNFCKRAGETSPFPPSSYAPVNEEAKQKHFVETLEVKVLYPKAEEATGGVL